MKAVIIGAGRGSRLRHLTEEIPKTLVPVLGRPMLDAILEALEFGGFSRKDVIFICGYRAEVIRERYPDLTYVENRDWQNNNILLSLLCAREHLQEGFVSTYADIVYRKEIVRDLVASPHDLAVG
ncbi:MAG: NTP transferase domain-containing protein, partial [Polyangiaceae bacterium]